MHIDYITKREIRLYFNEETDYRISKLFRDTRNHCDEIGIKMFSKSTVPTKIFCELWNLDYKYFIKTIKEKANGKN